MQITVLGICAVVFSSLFFVYIVRYTFKDIRQILDESIERDIDYLRKKYVLDKERVETSILIEGMNWCSKYGHEVDDELVHSICEDPHPKGCANCSEIGYRREVEVS